MNGRSTRTILATIGAVLLVILIAGLGFVLSGAYNVAATREHTAPVAWLLNEAMERSVAARADDVAEPPALDSLLAVDGFHHYDEMCAQCHGAPGVDRGEVGQGMMPLPPELAEEAEEFSAKELFWITKNGIRLAGMPAFGPTHTDEEIWGIVAFVRRMTSMTPADYERWKASAAQSGEAAEAEPGHTHEPGHEHVH